MKIIRLTSASTETSRGARHGGPRSSNGHYGNGATQSSNGHRGSQTERATGPSQASASSQADPLLRGLMPTGAGSGDAATCLPECPWNERMFVYCNKGRGWCEIEGKRHEILPGYLLVVLPASRHAYGTHGGCELQVIWVRAKGENLDSFIAELGATTERPVLAGGEDPQLIGLFHEMLPALEEPCRRPRLIYAAQTLGHLLGLLIWHTKDIEHARPDVGRRIELSIDYMQQHLAKPLHVATLAALINVSPSYYAVLFKRRTGCSPIDYFIRLRIKQACNLLESTSLHIKEIAALLGYDDPFYFSRVFRSVVRISPSEYRQSRREEEARELLGRPVSEVSCGAALRTGVSDY
jgi:AraC family transcriptional regulator of arabinose operon